VLLAAYADFLGSHGLAFDLLLLAIPCAAVAALGSFGSMLDGRDGSAGALEVLGSALVVVLLTLSCAVRSSAVHELPPVAFSTVFACLGIFALQAGAAYVPRVRTRIRPVRLRPVARSRLGEVSETSHRQRAA
jgi:hypothetical protein